MTYPIRSKDVITRKEQTCFGCLEKFPPGTQMATDTIAADGTIYTLHTCLPCVDFMDKHYEEIADGDGNYHEGCVAEFKREVELGIR